MLPPQKVYVPIWKRLWVIYLILALPSLLLAAANVRTTSDSTAPLHIFFGNIVGGMIGYLGVPAIVAVPWRWAELFFARPTSSPVAITILIWILVSSLSLTALFHR